MTEYTKAAMLYVRVERQRNDRAATWFDVSAAYDAGLKHGRYQPESAQEQLDQLRVQSSESEPARHE
jgi:hypothetical protein